MNDGMHRLDQSLLAATPLLAAPHYGDLPTCAIGQVRYLVGADGIYVEARTRVLHARGRISGCPWTPYGKLETFLRYPESLPPDEVLVEALERGRAALPNEWAGLVMLQDGILRLHVPRTVSASPHRIATDVHGIDPLDVLLDLHSHGRGRAFFSGTDDLDDAMSPSPVILAGVLGELHSKAPQCEIRLIIHGYAFQPDNLHEAHRLA